MYGAKASINVWAPKVAAPSEFSLSQIWIMSGLFSNDLNTIEAGWQVGFNDNDRSISTPIKTYSVYFLGKPGALW